MTDEKIINERKDVEIDKRSLLGLAAVLREILYGSMSDNDKLALAHSSLTVLKEAKAIDEFRDSIIAAHKTDRYKELNKKVSSNEATDEERKEFSSLDSIASDEINDLYRVELLSTVTLSIELISLDGFKKLLSANSSKLTGAGIVAINTYLVKE